MMTFQFTMITQNKSLSTHKHKCWVSAVLMWLALDNQHNIMILTAGQNPKGLRAEVQRPPGVRMVRPHVPLCCGNNPIIAAQHQIDVKLIHSSCELTGRPLWLHAATTYFTHFSVFLPSHAHNVSDKSGGECVEPICCPSLLINWPNQGMKKTPLSKT